MKGKLKIFFGYSAGVGKTYSMLKLAKSVFNRGVDIVIGYIEPHDRKDTLDMAKGLPKLPVKKIDYHGITLNELDVDGVINRRPQIVLVDELAHTNAPGSKNRKRYLDVTEILNHGIDVWTTVNVQHIESLHDLVGDATTVDVSERVPDEIFDLADEVVLIDIEPEELLERMRQGKIYSKQNTKTALENFFSKDKLTSLREIFLRRVADRLEKKSNNGMLKTKVLVLISPSPSSEKTIRVGARMSEAFHCKFSAMYVERDGELSDKSSQNLKRHIKLVEDLGGEVIIKYGDDVIETVATFVKLAGVTNLIIGKTWQSIGKKVGLEERFIKRLPDVEILIVPDSQQFLYKQNKLKKFLSHFMPKKLAQKYQVANKTLDIINLLTSGVLNGGEEQVVCDILSKAFMRSVALFNGKITLSKYENEDLSFFNTPNETAVKNWCLKNQKTCGKGTDTLRGANAIYFPLYDRLGNLYVIAFSCVKSKLSVTDRMIFYQLKKTLCAVL